MKKIWVFGAVNGLAVGSVSSRFLWHLSLGYYLLITVPILVIMIIIYSSCKD